MKKNFIPVFTFVFSVVCFSQTVSEKLNGEYCENAGNIMAFCISFKGDTFHYGILSMMFNFVGKGTYYIAERYTYIEF